MMEIQEFSTRTLTTLVKSSGGPHLTAYLRVPTQADRAEQLRIELKNTLQRAKADLTENWMSASDATSFLAPLARISEQLVDEASPETLALFLAEDFFQIFGIHKAIPVGMQIRRDFQIRPMIHATQDFAPAYLLAISENQVQLYEVTPNKIRPVDVSDMPINFEEELNVVGADRGQQVRTVGTFGNRPSIYHGQGGEADAHLAELRQYLHRIDQAITRLLGDSKTPLYLATVEATAAIYRDVTKYAHLQDEIVPGNPDHVSVQDLHAAILENITSAQRHARENLCSTVRENLHTPTASTEPSVIAPSAYQGRLRDLIIGEGLRIFGHYDETLGKAIILDSKSTNQLSPYGDDLVEAMIHQTIQNNGKVSIVPDGSLPETSLIAGILRY